MIATVSGLQIAIHIPPSMNANMSIQSKNRRENLLDTQREE